MKPVPIFIISFNRLDMLRQSIESYHQHIGDAFRLVIDDNASTYLPLLHYLDELERTGEAEVVRHTENPRLFQLAPTIRKTIDQWFQGNDADYYVVTDPDIALSHTRPDILQFYAYLLDSIDAIDVVEPMLRIDDIPTSYRWRTSAIDNHTEQFWGKAPQTVVWKGCAYHVLPSMIDTTFGMYRKGFSFDRLNIGLRTYAPYCARHLD